FSVPDAEAANQVDEGRIGANAFAALKELDFYTHKNTPYSAIFPGESSRVESTEPPFAFVRLASPSGYDYRLGQEGTTTPATVEELAKVCATSMFFEVLGGNQSLLESMHKDYAAKVALWGQPSENPPHYAKALSSFGAGTAHYPKYRIAGAAACKLLERQILGWAGKKVETNPDTLAQTTLESRVDEGKIAGLAQKWLHQAITASQGELTYGTKGRGKGSLADEFNAEFRNVFMPGGKPRQGNAVQMEQDLTSLPKERPFAQRFVRDGYFVRLLLARLPDYKKALAKNLQKAFDDAIDKIMAQDSIFTEDAQLNDLGEVQALYRYLCGEFLGQRINRSQSFSVAQVDTRFMEGFFREFTRAESSLASWTLGLSGPTQQYYRTKAVNIYQDALNREFLKMLEALEAEALKDLPRELKELVGDRIGRLLDKIRDSINILGTQYAKLVETDDFANLITVVTDAKKGLAFDAQKLVEKFDRTSWPQVYDEVSQNDPNNRKFKAMLMDPETDSQKAVNQISDVLIRRMMGSMDMSNFDMVDLLLKNYSVSFAHTARRTKPLVQLLATQHEILSQKKSPRLVCGGRAGSQERLLGFFKKNSVSEFESFQQDMAMQHMLHLYQEVAGFALNEMATCQALEAFYLDNLESRDVVKRVLHTDIMPSRFDIGRYKRLGDLTHEAGPGKPSLISLVGDFLNERFLTRRPLNETDDEIVFEWKEGGIPRDALYDPDNRDKFAWELAASPEGVRQFKKRVLDVMQALSEDDMIGLNESLRQRILKNHGRESKEMEEYIRIFTPEFVTRKHLPWWEMDKKPA
ncbi:MAG: tubulin-like doman-containing protein, partial [Desulfatibacillaceae bacterium]|nr:tubulin-like doman-containing protein [Desulfatibacillaceae bacterium]